jgi:hypothetical protein
MSNQCPIGAFQATQQLTGPITQTILTQIENRDKPFFLDIEPRGIRPTVIKDRYIQDSQNNFIEMNGIKYTIFSGIEISKPVHTGYIIPQQPANLSPVAELLFGAMSLINPQSPKIALICFPIFITNNTSAYSSYLDQLWNPEAKVANLQTLFLDSANDIKQVSINYSFCNKNMNNIHTNVYVFPIGISMPSTSWQKLINLIGSPKDSSFQSSLLTVTSEDFKKHFLYYSKPPGLRGKFNSSVCPAYKTSEYKCVPFDRIRDLDGDKVVLNRASTLSERLSKQDTAKENAINSVGLPSTDAQVGIIVAATAGASLGALLLIWAVSTISKRMD